LKHLTELKVLAEMAGQDFKSMPKQDMMTLVGRIERMDREETTKQDYKSLIRKFFRWLGREDIVDWTKIQVRKDANTILITTLRSRSWWRNLQGGVPISIRLKGQDMETYEDVIEDDENVTKKLIVYLQRFLNMQATSK
jgi:hypothetical protein